MKVRTLIEYSGLIWTDVGLNLLTGFYANVIEYFISIDIGFDENIII
jgi:hypothetical protein